MEAVLNSPYINTLSRQFVLTAITKISSRPTTSNAQRDRICEILEGYATNPALEIQQRAVEFINLFNQTEIRAGVLEQMPAPELKATVMGTGTWRGLMLSLPIPSCLTFFFQQLVRTGQLVQLGRIRM